MYAFRIFLREHAHVSREVTLSHSKRRARHDFVVILSERKSISDMAHFVMGIPCVVVTMGSFRTVIRLPPIFCSFCFTYTFLHRWRHIVVYGWVDYGVINFWLDSSGKGAADHFIHSNISHEVVRVRTTTNWGWNGA